MNNFNFVYDRIFSVEASKKHLNNFWSVTISCNSVNFLINNLIGRKMSKLESLEPWLARVSL